MDVQTRKAAAPTRVGHDRPTLVPAAAGSLAAGCGLIAVGALQEGIDRDGVLGALVLTVILGAVTLAVFGLVVRRALDAPAGRARIAVTLGILALVTVLAFWSGLPMVLGAAALVVGTDVRRRAAAGPGRAAGGIAAVVLGVLALTGAVAASVSDALSGTEPPKAVEVSAVEYGYGMPNEVTGGVVAFELANHGEQWHEFAFVRLAEGRTADDLLEAFATGEEPDWAEDLAGIPALSPGQRVTLTRTLDEPGTHVFLCALPSPSFEPHFELGMVTAFEVSGDSGAALPEPDVVITATDDGFVVPDIAAGRQVIELRNAGSEPHEFWITVFADGATDADVEDWIEGGQEGAAPAVFVGGIQTIPGGTSVFLDLELQRGVTYTLADYTTGAQTTLSPH